MIAITILSIVNLGICIYYYSRNTADIDNLRSLLLDMEVGFMAQHNRLLHLETKEDTVKDEAIIKKSVGRPRKLKLARPNLKEKN